MTTKTDVERAGAPSIALELIPSGLMGDRAMSDAGREEMSSGKF